MNKNINKKNKVNVWTWLTGYLTSLAIFIVGIILLPISSSSWIFLMLAIAGLIVAGLFLPKGKTNRKPLSIIGTALLIITIIMLGDIYDESIHQYTGNGFSSGNGFLFDGLGVLIYYIFAPMFILGGAGLLLFNSILKHRSTKYTVVTSLRFELVPALAIIATSISLLVAGYVLVSFKSAWLPSFVDFTLTAAFVALIICIITTFFAKKKTKVISVVCICINLIILVALDQLRLFIPPHY